MKRFDTVCRSVRTVYHSGMSHGEPYDVENMPEESMSSGCLDSCMSLADRTGDLALIITGSDAMDR